MRERWEYSWPGPRSSCCRSRTTPPTTCVDLDFMQQVVDFAREKDVLLVHDFAYADLGFDGYSPPSILQVDGAKDVAVELYSMTKSFSMAGWRVAFMLGNAEVVGALAKLKSYLDYGAFQPIQIAATVTLNEAPTIPSWSTTSTRVGATALSSGLNRIGWEIEPPRARCSPGRRSPSRTSTWARSSSASWLVREAKVATSPGVGFGPGGEGYIRFALIENEQRTAQAIRQLKSTLTNLEAPAELT